jgi:glycosyltransferase involved in cell wall biosynthesis
MRKLRSEQAIIANWAGNISKPIVSICCITYNHEKFIKDTLKGFLIQETNFPFEIIIHDDASIDATVDIIREYASAYPHIIKPIFQIENQYSKSPSKPGMTALEACTGEFIALCEGDDYWTSNEKLSNQYKVFSDNLNTSLVFHQGILVDKDNNTIGRSKFFKKGRVDANQVLKSGGGFCLTASIMLRKSVAERMTSSVMLGGAAGDVILQNLAVLEGNVVALEGQYCAYRVNHPGSYSARSNRGISNKDNNSRYSSMCKFYCYMKIELSDFDPKLLRSLNYWFNQVEYFTALGFLEQKNIKRFKIHIIRSIGLNMNVNFSAIIIYLLFMTGLDVHLLPFFRRLKKKVKNSVTIQD